MMEYYFLSNSADKDIIGSKYPQCKGLPNGDKYNYKWFEQPNSMTNLTNDEFPNFELDLIFELDRGAKLTDVISPSNISAKGFLINEKVKNIFDQFNIMEHQYYPATLIYKEKKLNYFWLHFKEIEEEYLGNVDFINSKFYISNLSFTKIDDIEISSYVDFWNKKMNLSMKHIRAERIKLNSNFRNKCNDLFFISYVVSNYFCSHNLRDKIIDNKITGLEIKPQNILI